MTMWAPAAHVWPIESMAPAEAADTLGEQSNRTNADERRGTSWLST
jgi:hypothetical protein